MIHDELVSLAQLMLNIKCFDSFIEIDQINIAWSMATAKFIWTISTGELKDYVYYNRSSFKLHPVYVEKN